MKDRLAMVTIGQSPRSDMVPEMLPYLPETDIVEYGALDDLSAAGIADLAPTPDSGVLVSRLRDGSSARLARDRMEPLVRQAILRAEEAAEATLLVCTGEFEDFPHRRPLLTAERLLVNGVAGLAHGLRLGVVCPEPDQAAMSEEKWRALAGAGLLVEAASPYRQAAEWAVAAAARRLSERGAEIVVLDCMGYTESMRSAAVVAAGVPVVLARALVARMAAEVVCG